MNQYVSRQQGFTLVEMAVVLGILTVLIALGLSVVGAAHRRARQAVCLSNLGQLDKALLMYAGDNDNLLPPYQNDFGAGGHITTASGHYTVAPARSDLLVSSLQPYLHSDAVWFCPEDPVAHTHTPQWAIDHFYTSYQVSVFLGVVGHPATADGTQIVPFDVPTTNLVLVSDDSEQGGRTCHPTYSHNGEFNYLCFDGHVSSAKPDCAP